jgi:hypothetical protein
LSFYQGLEKGGKKEGNRKSVISVITPIPNREKPGNPPFPSAAGGTRAGSIHRRNKEQAMSDDFKVYCTLCRRPCSPEHAVMIFDHAYCPEHGAELAINLAAPPIRVEIPADSPFAQFLRKAAGSIHRRTGASNA